MLRSIFVLAITLFLVGGFSAAQEKDKAASSTTGAENETRDSAEVDVHFLNGSLIRMHVRTEKLEIDTAYGRLSVPIKDVRSIEFGLRFPEGAAEKIRSAIKDLGGTEFKARDAAVRSLLDLAPFSYGSVLAASRTKELELSRRAKDIVKQIEAKFTTKELRTTEEDKVETRSFPIMGRILTPTLKSKTELFGDVELSLAKMGTLKAVGGKGTTSDVAVTIDAATYANGGQWLETAFESDGRSALTITAKGVVDTWPQQPNQWVCGPNGAGQGGRMILNNGGIIVGGGGGFGRPGGGAALMQMSGGALFGRIGESGEPFLIGERYNATPKGEGKLYLAIAPSPWGCPSSGSYEVKISR